MKFLKCAFVSVLFVVLCSCSADNTSKPDICQKIIFAPDERGGVSATVQYVSDYGEEVPDETFRAADAKGIVSLLLCGDTMYKPLKSVEFSDSLDARTERELLCELMNADEFQLKCTAMRGGNVCGTLAEYYREKMNTAYGKGEGA